MAYDLKKPKIKKIAQPYVTVKGFNECLKYRTEDGVDYIFTGNERKPVYNLTHYQEFHSGRKHKKFSCFIARGYMSRDAYAVVEKDMNKTLDWARANGLPESKE